jgi:large subunit ribosomal protein L25
MLELKTTPREAKAKAKDGLMSAVYYGGHTTTTPIFVDSIEFNKVFRSAGESASITLVTANGKETVMIQDVQRHPVKNHIIHADFYVLEKGQKVHVKIPIVYVGESSAVKSGGVLVKVLHELSVEADPSKLPQNFEVDLSLLVTSADAIHISDIKLPSGVELYHVHAEDVVASIAAQHEETDAPAPVDLTAIEVEKKGKKEEEAKAE